MWRKVERVRLESGRELEQTEAESRENIALQAYLKLSARAGRLLLVGVSVGLRCITVCIERLEHRRQLGHLPRESLGLGLGRDSVGAKLLSFGFEGLDKHEPVKLR